MEDYDRVYAHYVKSIHTYIFILKIYTYIFIHLHIYIYIYNYYIHDVIVDGTCR